ncbi:hypothetical protein PCE1_003244 [Barthelona sp. PCE]
MLNLGFKRQLLLLTVLFLAHTAALTFHEKYNGYEYEAPSSTSDSSRYFIFERSFSESWPLIMNFKLLHGGVTTTLTTDCKKELDEEFFRVYQCLIPARTASNEFSYVLKVRNLTETHISVYKEYEKPVGGLIVSSMHAWNFTFNFTLYLKNTIGNDTVQMCYGADCGGSIVYHDMFLSDGGLWEISLSTLSVPNHLDLLTKQDFNVQIGDKTIPRSEFTIMTFTESESYPQQIFSNQRDYGDILHVMAEEQDLDINSIQLGGPVKICLGTEANPSVACTYENPNYQYRVGDAIEFIEESFFDMYQYIDPDTGFTRSMLRTYINTTWETEAGVPDGLYFVVDGTELQFKILDLAVYDVKDGFPHVEEMSPKFIEFDVASDPIEISATITNHMNSFHSYYDQTPVDLGDGNYTYVKRLAFGTDGGGPLAEIDACLGVSPCDFSLNIDKQMFYEGEGEESQATFTLVKNTIAAPITWTIGKRVTIPAAVDIQGGDSNFTIWRTPTASAISANTFACNSMVSLELYYDPYVVPDLRKNSNNGLIIVQDLFGNLVTNFTVDLNFAQLDSEKLQTFILAFELDLSDQGYDSFVELNVLVSWDGVTTPLSSTSTKITCFNLNEITSVTPNQIGYNAEEVYITLASSKDFVVMPGRSPKLRVIPIGLESAQVDIDSDDFTVNGAEITAEAPSFSFSEDATVEILYSPNGEFFATPDYTDTRNQLNYISSIDVEVAGFSQYILTDFCTAVGNSEVVDLTITLVDSLPEKENVPMVYVEVMNANGAVLYTQQVLESDIDSEYKVFTVTFDINAACGSVTTPGIYKIALSANVSPIYYFMQTEVVFTGESTVFSEFRFNNTLKNSFYQYGGVKFNLLGSGFSPFVGLSGNEGPKLKFTGALSTSVADETTDLIFLNDTHAEFTLPSFRYAVETTLMVSYIKDTFQSIDGLTFSFEKCELGWYQTTFLDVCNECPLGTYGSERGISQCTSADEGYYVDQLASTSASVCPEFALSGVGATDILECYCRDDYYGERGLNCTACPTGGECIFPNNVWPVASAGYYANETNPEVISECIPAIACVGVQAANCSSLSDCNQCATGYAGDRCASCDTNYYKSNELCKECPSTDYAQVGILSVLGVFAVYVGIIVQSAASELTDDVNDFLELIQSDQMVKMGKEAFKTAKSMFKQLRLTKLGIFVNFAQVFSVFPDFNISLGPLEEWFEKIFEWFSLLKFDFLTISPPECYTPLSFYDYYKLKMLIVPVSYISLVLVGFLIWLIPRILGCFNGCHRRQKTITDIHDKVMSLFIIILIYTYTYISDSVISYANCTTTSDVSTQKVIAKSPETVCYTDEYNDFAPMYYLGLILYVVGIPVSLMVILRQLKKRDSLGKPRAKAWLGIMYEHYRPHRYLYEPLIMVKKLLIVLSTVIFTDKYEGTLVGCFFLFLYLLMQVRMMPYAESKDNVLEFLSLLTNFYLLLSLLLMNSNLSTRAKTWLSTLDFILIGLNTLFFAMLFITQIRDLCKPNDEKDVEEEADVDFTMYSINGEMVPLSGEAAKKASEFIRQLSRKQGHRRMSVVDAAKRFSAARRNSMPPPMEGEYEMQPLGVEPFAGVQLQAPGMISAPVPVMPSDNSEAHIEEVLNFDTNSALDDSDEDYELPAPNMPSLTEEEDHGMHIV